MLADSSLRFFVGVVGTDRQVIPGVLVKKKKTLTTKHTKQHEIDE